ncbi:STAS domain-containing protein [Actinoplanes solisilvae]|uniref:STAS domain-containing protein n=1 Tax=Actinoplanes solisilvae TaxID=2486853 RepID=UPI000FDB6B77|nr:STAS domain-containing protein [Actinoplanes solisilvae]
MQSADVRPASVSIALTTPAALVRVSGDVDVDIVSELRQRLDEAVALRPVVIVDLTAAGTIDSLCLGILVRARNAARRNGGDVLLVIAGDFLMTVLKAQRLHDAFRTFDTVPQAITAASTR